MDVIAAHLNCAHDYLTRWQATTVLPDGEPNERRIVSHLAGQQRRLRVVRSCGHEEDLVVGKASDATVWATLQREHEDLCRECRQEQIVAAARSPEAIASAVRAREELFG